MTKLLLTLATTTAAIALINAAPAQAHGGGHGGFGFGGGSFASRGPVAIKSAPVMTKFSQPSGLGGKTFSNKVMSGKTIHHDHDVHHTASVTKVKDVPHHAHVDQVVHEKHDMKQLKTVGMGSGGKITLGKPQQLSSAQFMKAKIDDGKGRKYDVLKKAWWDGHHWWFGRFAWLYIDDTWYYGNTAWREADGAWVGDGVAEAPVCLDCRPTATAPVSTASLAASQSDDAPKVVTHKRKPKVEQEPVATVATAAVTPPVTTAALATPPVAVAEVAQPPVTPEVTQPVVNERECRKFLPQLGMAVTVPCEN